MKVTLSLTEIALGGTGKLIRVPLGFASALLSRATRQGARDSGVPLDRKITFISGRHWRSQMGHICQFHRQCHPAAPRPDKLGPENDKGS